jgi:hypothetical protein
MGYIQLNLDGLKNKILKLLEIKKFDAACYFIEKSTLRAELNKFQGSFNSYPGGTLIFSLPLFPYTELTSNSEVKIKIGSQIISCLKLANSPDKQGVDLQTVKFDYDDKLDEEITKLELTAINSLSQKYLDQQISKCNVKIVSGDYDGVVTNARTVLETIFLKIIEKIDRDYKYDGHLPKLYKDVSKQLNFDPVSQKSESVKQIFSGFVSIVNGISSYRNEFSDAHGKSETNKVILKRRHAQLAINCVMTIGDYFLNLLEDRNTLIQDPPCPPQSMK